MHLAIDVRETCRTPLTGKGRWTAGFVSALYDAGVTLTLLSDHPLSSFYAKKWKNVDLRVIKASGMLWHLRAMRSILHDNAIDAYVSTTSYLVPCMLRGRKPCVTIVHDLIAFRNEPHDKRATFIEHISLQFALRHSSLVCTVSDATKRDLLEKFSFVTDKAVAIYAGSDLPIASNISKGDGPVLSIGTLCPRKNQLRLIQAHSKLPLQLREKHPLILIGARGWADDPIIDAVHVTDHVSWKGKVSDDERNDLLRDAVLCAFPSLYEGFGLPVLEAFSLGIPVLTSAAGSLAEVAGDAAYVVDPLDESAITDGLQTMLQDSNLRKTFAEKGLKRATLFSWEKTTDLFFAALKNIDL